MQRSLVLESGVMECVWGLRPRLHATFPASGAQPQGRPVSFQGRSVRSGGGAHTRQPVLGEPGVPTAVTGLDGPGHPRSLSQPCLRGPQVPVLCRGLRGAREDRDQAPPRPNCSRSSQGPAVQTCGREGRGGLIVTSNLQPSLPHGPHAFCTEIVSSSVRHVARTRPSPEGCVGRGPLPHAICGCAGTFSRVLP